MQFTRIVLGWLAAGFVFMVVDVLRGRGAGGRASAPRWLPFAEALPLTLLLALWFASLGNGMWPLVLALLALAIEAPARLAEVAKGDKPGRAVLRAAPTLAKVALAGLAMRWIL